MVRSLVFRAGSNLFHAFLHRSRSLISLRSAFLRVLPLFPFLLEIGITSVNVNIFPAIKHVLHRKNTTFLCSSFRIFDNFFDVIERTENANKTLIKFALELIQLRKWQIKIRRLRRNKWRRKSSHVPTETHTSRRFRKIIPTWTLRTRRRDTGECSKTAASLGVIASQASS